MSITESFFVPDLIKIKNESEADPENTKLQDVLQEAVAYMNTRYDGVMETQFYMVMYSEGAMTMSDIDNMTVPERNVFLFKLKGVEQSRKDQISKMKKGG